MKNILEMTIALALGVGAASPALAEVRISGFGQAVVATTGDDDEPFPDLGFDGDVDAKNGSLFAIQINADLNDRVDAVAQVMARGERDFDAELAWAYANIDLGRGWGMKLGRQRLALYRYSDFLDVGYAYPWIRPPVSVYNLGFNTLDGISFVHTGFFGDWFSQLQVQAGGYAGEARLGASYLDTELDGLVGVSWDLEYNEWLGLRAAVFQGDLTVRGSDLDGLVAQLQANSLGGLASRLAYDGDTGVFTNVAARIDRGGWLLQAEYVTVSLDDSLFSDKHDWYVSAGYRMGTLTPTLTYGRRDADPKTELLSGVPAPFLPFVAGAVGSEAYDDQYVGLGLRWDVYEKVAVKVDWTRFESDTTAAITGRTDSDLLSAGVVFTF